MKAIDILLSLLIPTLILLHLLVAPYTKVEESFNIQATHDIISYSTPFRNLFQNLPHFDHFSFPGAVPRTFVGALLLGAISKPIIALTSADYAQFAVRATLGLLNAFALLRYKNGLEKAFGRDVGRWYILLQATQFHVIYYASRTLPNMFAFGLTTLAFREFLPSAHPTEVQTRQRLGIFQFVLAGVIFRSEVALLLFTQLLWLLIQPRMSLETMIPAGIKSGLVALAISVPIDSYFWQKPIWPELAGFYYNAIQGKSADWGTSPYLYYFNSLLPRLLLNPLIMTLLIPVSFVLPATKYNSRSLVIPAVLFIAIYGLQPHKESRFIIYVVPPLTAAASLGASYIWSRRSKNLLYRLGSLVLIASVLGSFAASTVMLLISSLNYPGGEAITQLRTIIAQTELPSKKGSWENTYVHMDVLSCMTGVTRFQEIPSRFATDIELTLADGQSPHTVYDKEEDEEKLLQPWFWEQFDYALMEEPGKAIGKWEVVGTVYAYAGIEFLRPSEVSSSKQGEDGVERKTLGDLKAGLSGEEMSRFGIYKLVRDAVRLVTGGYWIGPRMEPTIRILKRVKEPLP